MLEQTDKKLLNILQTDFPLEERPFNAIAERLGLSEPEVLNRTTQLQNNGVIRHISAFVDPQKLSYKTTLVAFHVSQAKLENAAETINGNRGVSHNYGRNHYWNLWFTLALPRTSNLAKEIETLARRSQAEEYLILPALRIFKLNTSFDMTGEGLLIDLLKSPQTSYQVDAGDKAIINQIQEDLPLVSQPFDEWANQLRIETAILLARLKGLIHDGVVRRFGASLAHNKVGLVSNAMVCWQASNEEVEDKGNKLASFSWVSHCYERLSCREWPFNLYTMLHLDTPEACREAVSRMSLETGITQYQMLLTIKEYKKIKGKYRI